MTAYHHSTADFSSTLADAREHMRRTMMRDAKRAATGFQTLQDRVIVDELVQLADVNYQLHGSQLTVNGKGITSQAFGQLCAKADLPVGFARKLQGHASPLVQNLVLENLETLSAVSEDTVMLRSVNGIHHGVVTDAYKRMDARMIAGTLAVVSQEHKLVPIACDLSNTRIYVRFMLPRIYGEEFGEALAFGLELRASDFGFGRLELNPFCNRVFCTNKAFMGVGLGKGFSKTHRGARLTEDTFQLSAATQELQAAAMASELNDGVKGLLSGESIATYTQAIGNCFREARLGGKYDVAAEIEKLTKARKLSEKQATFVADAYKSNDRDVVPQVADGRWRLAQAVAYAAQWMDIADVDTRVDLEYLAGEIVDSAPAGAVLAAAN